MTGQCRIDERFLTIESLRCAATRQAMIVRFVFDDFGEEFRNGAQPERVPPVPTVERLPKHKLSAIRVVAQIQPIVDFAPTLRALRNCRPRLPRVDTADHDVYTIKPAFRIQPFWNAFPIQTPKHIQPIGEDDRLIKANLRLTKGLSNAVRRRDRVRIKQSDVQAFRMSAC